MNIGLGDVVKYGLGKLGIHQKSNCGCAKRQAWLNRMTPGYSPRGAGFDIIEKPSVGYELHYSDTGKRSPMSVGWMYAIRGGSDITAADCSVAAVQTAINNAVNGDRVIIPNGICDWAAGITTTKQITIMGQSVGGVTINHTAGAATLLTMTIGAAFRTEIANLRFMPGTGSGRYFSINGTGLVPFLHDCYFNIPDFQLNPSEWLVTGGVIWNVTVESTTINGTSGSNGSGSTWLTNRIATPWLAASTMGTLDTLGTQNLYIEDSTFINLYNSAYDGDDNARLVVRHCTIRNTQMITHGTTSLQGGRHVELYDNAYQYRLHPVNPAGNTSINLNRYFWMRAGTMVFTGNSVENITSQDWGDRSELVFIVESATRSGSGSGCCTVYPCIHQPGSGANGSVQISDPVYIWNNTGTYIVGLNDHDPPLQTCFNGVTTATFFQLNRDYFRDTSSNPNNGAKPGWSRFTYPHPLRTLASGAPRTYTTAFPVIENPISEGGNWINGQAQGVAWANCRTIGSPNRAIGTQIGNANPPTNDSTCIVTGQWGANQTAQGTIFIANASTTVFEEVELRLRTTINVNSIIGYEVNYGLGQGSPYVQVVRWNGPLNNFTLINATAVSFATGNILRASISGLCTPNCGADPVIVSVYKSIDDGQTFSLILTATDNGNLGGTPVVAAGAPGVGFFLQDQQGGNQSALNANFGFTCFAASDSGAPINCNQVIVVSSPNPPMRSLRGWSYA